MSTSGVAEVMAYEKARQQAEYQQRMMQAAASTGSWVYDPAGSPYGPTGQGKYTWESDEQRVSEFVAAYSGSRDEPWWHGLTHPFESFHNWFVEVFGQEGSKWAEAVVGFGVGWFAPWYVTLPIAMVGSGAAQINVRYADSYFVQGMTYAGVGRVAYAVGMDIAKNLDWYTRIVRSVIGTAAGRLAWVGLEGLGVHLPGPLGPIVGVVAGAIVGYYYPELWGGRHSLLGGQVSGLGGFERVNGPMGPSYRFAPNAFGWLDPTR
jgi:hypothetical protein